MKYPQAVLIPALIMCAGATGACQAQTAGGSQDLRQEVEELKKNQEALQEELNELKAILEPVLARLPRPFRPQEVSVAGSPSMGEESADLVLVEFSDLQCPFCVRYYDETFPKIMENFIETGKVRYVAREFPLSRIHPQAQRASEAALCAGEQDKYWELRAKIFANRQNLSESEVEGYAKEVGVDLEPWKACMETDHYREQVEKDLRDVQKLGITGTPSFVIGRAGTGGADSFLATKLLQGAVPYEQFEAAINDLLTKSD